MGGLVSQLTKTSVDVDGTTRKRLTAPGKWALIISLLGFAGSFSSELLNHQFRRRRRPKPSLS